MSRPSVWSASLALAILVASAGCFEVPPLPEGMADAEAECVDEGDCELGEACVDAFCEVLDEDFVTLSVDCRGVAGAVIVVRCGVGTQSIPCMGDGTDADFDCPINDTISVCCGESDNACANPSRAGVIRVLAKEISPEPEDGWTCDPGPGLSSLTCTHPGFATHAGLVTHFECDVSEPGR